MRFAWCLGLLVLPGAALACGPDEVTFRDAKARFTVEIVDTATERAQGLMNRESLGSAQGMLFVYDAPGHPHFWMKNTLIPLDMIFIGPDGLVTRVHPDAVPHDETSIDGGAGVQYVLEINGGLAGAIGLKPGDAMIWQGLGDAALMPCN
ncbi:DUF192 domain-containing protein [Stagnihabitans tardus]|uniref:DUF192 domain-containing protein n=1 Tax=Stagnihabitans tardus TaxID=2699202 RepID=A0AAE4Y9L2_9RHOB|nr:DUF192 domain-containing protein [Stagnihabitans tardus]NBZ86264.1 DUF192 domain-containing protein [Stagnihabitans tardus]